MSGGISSRTLAAPTSIEVSMNAHHVVTALAAIRRGELIAEARCARLVRESRAATKRRRPALDHPAALITQPSSSTPTAGLIHRRDPDERHATSRPAEPVCLSGDRR
jgi:hypothetical protein